MLANISRRAFQQLTGHNSRAMSSAVYMWAQMPRLSAKSGSVAVKYEMPKGAPRRIEAYDDLNVKLLRIGLRHSAVISGDGKLYTFGQSNWGVLGHGDEKFVSFNKPKLVESLAHLKVKDVQLGEYHTMALTECGQVFTWGYGGKKGLLAGMFKQEVGALGHNDFEPHFFPKKVEYFEQEGIKVDKIAAGNYHCIAVSTENMMYTWGRGQYGVLGNGSNSKSLVPLPNDEFKYHMESSEDYEKGSFGFRAISAADNYSAAVLKDGSAYVWGMNDRGQMGIGAGVGIDLVESESTPQELDFDLAFPGEVKPTEPIIITDVTCGQNTMLLRDHKNRIYKTGLKLDYTPKMVQFKEDLLPANKVDQMACGRRHYVVLDTDGNIHINGKVVSAKSIGTHDAFQIYDADELFDGGKVKQLSMQYEMYGALVEHKDQ